MTDFMIHFLICNLFIGVIIILLFGLKRIFRNTLTGRTQYNLWFLLLALLAVPFLPISSGQPAAFLARLPFGVRRILSGGGGGAGTASGAASADTAAGWMNDFAISVSSRTPSILGLVLTGVWTAGILIMILLVIRSSLRLRRIKKSALPLQNPEVQTIYAGCLRDMNLTKSIPVYSTAFLESPVITGYFRPRIYLPIHLISDCRPSEIRYILLHELQHYRHRDNLVNYLMILAGILYWFNPLVWTAFAAIRGDREIACDASVLRILDKEDYRDYGFTLINFAEKLSHTVFPFSAGLGGSMKQIRRRILNIAAYRKPSALKMMKNIAVYSLTAALLAGLSPALFSHASEDEHYQWSASGQNISSIDMAEYFDGYDGSFVLYDLNNDRWSIYNEDQASVRVSPDSTYKIYDALFALEEGIISPDASGLAWDGTLYPFESWNQDQTLASALSVSANWYFQELDRQMGTDVIQSRIREIGYGNENISGSPDSYWMESGLKISPIEQVKLLTDLYRNTFDFAPENIRAVKDSLRLSASRAGTLYGKTGTGQVDGQNVNGWFVGFTETADNTYFFAVNIHAESNASGSSAAEIALDVLDEMDIWKQPDGNRED